MPYRIYFYFIRLKNDVSTKDKIMSAIKESKMAPLYQIYAKEIEIQEIQYINQFYAENDRVVRRYFQTFYAFAANLLFFCYGIFCLIKS